MENLPAPVVGCSAWFGLVCHDRRPARWNTLIAPPWPRVNNPCPRSCSACRLPNDLAQPRRGQSELEPCETFPPPSSAAAPGSASSCGPGPRRRGARRRRMTAAAARATLPNTTPPTMSGPPDANPATRANTPTAPTRRPGSCRVPSPSPIRLPPAAERPSSGAGGGRTEPPNWSEAAAPLQRLVRPAFGARANRLLQLIV